MLKVLMISSEAAPFAKTGGLADVVGALPAALEPHGISAAVFLPRYGSINLNGAARVYDRLMISLGASTYTASIYRIDTPAPFFLLDCPPLFERSGFYGNADGDYPDNYVRFAAFCRAALAASRHLFRADIFHCHDWQAGLVPAYLKALFPADPNFAGVRTIFTIHNLGYQGIFPASVLPEIGLDRRVLTIGGMEYWGKISYLKAGITYSDWLTTVSRGYAREIQTPEYGFGMDGLLLERSDRLTGILNGVDYSQWSPEADRYIAAHYSADDVTGKIACKRDLLREFDLPASDVDQPLLGIVSRFTSQKGADIIAEAMDLLAGEAFRLVALGTGEPQYEAMFQEMESRFPGKIRVRIGYDNALAHKIEAGADIFVMPSRYEPSGLNQMYSLRYGTVPVVRATGGLDDTIEVDTGFKFPEYSGEALADSIRKAIAAYGDRERWQDMMRRGMRKDYSWNASAAEYAALYRRVAGRG